MNRKSFVEQALPFLLAPGWILLSPSPPASGNKKGRKKRLPQKKEDEREGGKPLVRGGGKEAITAKAIAPKSLRQKRRWKIEDERFLPPLHPFPFVRIANTEKVFYSQRQSKKAGRRKISIRRLRREGGGKKKDVTP